ncbi:hypothetical protein ACPV5V_19350, partial [Vibrio campbellii]
MAEKISKAEELSILVVKLAFITVIGYGISALILKYALDESWARAIAFASIIIIQSIVLFPLSFIMNDNKRGIDFIIRTLRNHHNFRSVYVDRFPIWTVGVVFIFLVQVMRSLEGAQYLTSDSAYTHYTVIFEHLTPHITLNIKEWMPQLNILLAAVFTIMILMSTVYFSYVFVGHSNHLTTFLKDILGSLQSSSGIEKGFILLFPGLVIYATYKNLEIQYEPASTEFVVIYLQPAMCFWLGLA